MRYDTEIEALEEKFSGKKSPTVPSLGLHNILGKEIVSPTSGMQRGLPCRCMLAPQSATLVPWPDYSADHVLSFSLLISPPMPQTHRELDLGKVNPADSYPRLSCGSS